MALAATTTTTKTPPSADSGVSRKQVAGAAPNTTAEAKHEARHEGHPRHLSRSIRNDIAAILSILPGAGHIYKRYYLMGFGLMLLMTPLMLWASLLLSLTTFGFGALLFVLYWAGVATHAYYVPVRHHGIGDPHHRTFR